MNVTKTCKHEPTLLSVFVYIVKVIHRTCSSLSTVRLELSLIACAAT